MSILIKSMVSNLSLIQSYIISKDTLVRGCIEQRCDRGKSSVLDFLDNDRDFFYIEICLIKIIMYSIDCYSIVDMSNDIFINELLGSLKKQEIPLIQLILKVFYSLR